MKDWQEHEAIYKVYTEGKKLEAGKYHGRFDKTAKELRALGASVPSRDAIHFISNLLEYVGIFAEDETDSVVKNNKFAEKRLRFLELLDIHSEEIKSSAADIEENYDSQLKQYFGVESANRGSKGRQDKYSANAANIEIKKQQKEELQKLKTMASGGAADALNVLSAGLDEAENEMFGSLKASFEDPTTIIEIKLKNPGFADKVVNFLKPFAGDSEIESYGDSVEFSAEPDSQIAKLVAKIGRDKVEDTINDWLDDNTSGGIAIITPPDEPGSAERLVAPKARRAPMNEPEDTDVDPEYGSALPDAPEMGDEERYSPRSSSRPSFMGDDEDYGGESDYTPNWAREDDEHEGARRSPEEGEYDRSEDYDEDAYNDEADLDDDGELSEYEKKRGGAIKKAMKKDKEENNEDIKMSPQQMNQWMYNQRNSRMQNNLRQNERWGNY